MGACFLVCAWCSGEKSYESQLAEPRKSARGAAGAQEKNGDVGKMLLSKFLRVIPLEPRGAVLRLRRAAISKNVANGCYERTESRPRQGTLKREMTRGDLRRSSWPFKACQSYASKI